jgi:hypothetical protein
MADDGSQWFAMAIAQSRFDSLILNHGVTFFPPAGQNQLSPNVQSLLPNPKNFETYSKGLKKIFRSYRPGYDRGGWNIFSNVHPVSSSMDSLHTLIGGIWLELYA